MYYGVSEALMRGEKSKRRLTKIAGGIFLGLLGLLVIYIGLLALIAALFFFFAGMAEFVKPAVITGLIVVAIAAVILVEAYRSIRS